MNWNWCFLRIRNAEKERDTHEFYHVRVFVFELLLKENNEFMMLNNKNNLKQQKQQIRNLYFIRLEKA